MIWIIVLIIITAVVLTAASILDDIKQTYAPEQEENEL